VRAGLEAAAQATGLHAAEAIGELRLVAVLRSADGPAGFLA
jgi:hypothetical protein